MVPRLYGCMNQCFIINTNSTVFVFFSAVLMLGRYMDFKPNPSEWVVVK